MFTGIIEEIGIIENIKRGATSGQLTIKCSKVLEDAKPGDSIAVNGVCLTITSMGSSRYTADVMTETMDRSSLGNMTKGTRVNLERAMAANGRFGGHIVAGHVDGVGTIESIHRDEIAIWYKISVSRKILRYIVEKGSIAIDGISLTVAEVTDSSFSVSVIPHTQGETNLIDRKVGDKVNLECDIIGKYVEKLVLGGASADDSKNNTGGETKLTESFLAENGFI
ncbi:riboflavin synthase [Eubacterium xylanophilum]|uniref:riboflavin synthase n=1 Tax=Eubacterium xylanophilum TaxID=39497 RepID=UPI000479E4B2|nr:riboflavin synthase [Eubacterium xylanophilum]